MSEDRRRELVAVTESTRVALEQLKAKVEVAEADRWQARLTGELKRQHDELTKQMEELIAKQRNEIVNSVDKESKDRVRQLKELELRLQAFERVFDWHSEYEGIAHKVGGQSSQRRIIFFQSTLS
jgi:TolA-binding protein